MSHLSILEKITYLEKMATEFGFKWENPQQIIEQIKSELIEINEHLETPHKNNTTELLQEEIGDLIHATLSLCLFCNLNPEDTLQKSTKKFENRLNAVMDIAQQQGLVSLDGQSFEKLMSIWDQAKQKVG